MSLIFAWLAFTASNTHATTVLDFGAWKAKRCKTALGDEALRRLDADAAARVHAELLADIEATDSKGVLMRIDVTGRVWDWMPLDPAQKVEVTIERDADLWPRQVMVTRAQGLDDYTIRDPARIAEIETALKHQLQGAWVIVDDDFEALFARPVLTEGLLF